MRTQLDPAGVYHRLAVRPGGDCTGCHGARAVTVRTYDLDPRGRVTTDTIDELCVRCLGTGAEPDTGHLLPAGEALPPGWRWATSRDRTEFLLPELDALGAPPQAAPWD